MTDVHAIAAGTSAGVEEERNALFILVKNLIEIPVTEDHTSAKKTVRFTPGHLLEASQERRVNSLGTKVFDQFIIIYGFCFSMLVNAT